MSTVERSTPRPGPSPRPVDETHFVPDHLVEAFAVTDPDEVRRLKADREATGLDRRDEMWEGMYVMSPSPNFEHQTISDQLWLVFWSVLGLAGGGVVIHDFNVSDRIEGWTENYRIPDIAVYLSTNSSINRGTHMVGGPDLAVEILSEGDLARKKLDFYARIGTRELLLLDRHPWALELYRLADGRLDLVGVSTPDGPEFLTSTVLPLTLGLLAGEGRPTIELSRTDGEQSWRI